MSSSALEAVYSMTAPVENEDMKSNGHATCVKPSSERSDTKMWRSHYQNRSENLFKTLQYFWILSFPIFGVFYYLIYQFMLAIQPYTFILETNAWWTPDTSWIFTLNAPGVVSELIPFSFLFGACLPLKPFRYTTSPKLRSFRVLRVCLVSKGTNVATVMKTIAPWTVLRHIDHRLKFHIVLDGGSELAMGSEIPSFVNINEVPKSYTPKYALYKARALEFFRGEVGLEEKDWVLHLDEETQIDSYAIKTVIDFIERGDRLIGMGTILYNTGVYWRNPFLTAVELYRVVADWGSFRLPVYLWKRPMCGWLHGSFILINGDVENRVTWDTSCVAEDYWFGVQAVKLGFKFGWIDAVAREQPAMSVRDLINQRRRWFSGVWSTGKLLPRLTYIGQIWTLTGYIYSLYCTIFRFGQVNIPFWVVHWGAIHSAQQLLSTGSSAMIQDVDAGGVSMAAMAWHILFSWVFWSHYYFLETLIKVYAICYPPKGFHVIKKA